MSCEEEVSGGDTDILTGSSTCSSENNDPLPIGESSDTEQGVYADGNYNYLKGHFVVSMIFIGMKIKNHFHTNGLVLTSSLLHVKRGLEQLRNGLLKMPLDLN